MYPSSKALLELSQKSGLCDDPGFEVIVSFAYYDGPEQGLALFPSGCGVRFASLGDSRSRMLRAFGFVSIEGVWSSAVRSALNITGGYSHRILVPGPSDAVTRLDDDVVRAPAIDFFVAVGRPGLEKISVAQVDKEQLARLTLIDAPLASFRAVCGLIKEVRGARQKGARGNSPLT